MPEPTGTPEATEEPEITPEPQETETPEPTEIPVTEPAETPDQVPGTDSVNQESEDDSSEGEESARAASMKTETVSYSLDMTN